MRKGATGWEPDDEMVVYPIVSCDDCEYCLAGEQTQCPTYEIIEGIGLVDSRNTSLCPQMSSIHSWRI